MKTKNSRPITHWLTQRISAIFILILFLLGPARFLLVSINILVFLHLYLGLEEILADYIHNELIESLFLILLKLLIFIAIKYAFLFFVF